MTTVDAVYSAFKETSAKSILLPIKIFLFQNEHCYIQINARTQEYARLLLFNTVKNYKEFKLIKS